VEFLASTLLAHQSSERERLRELIDLAVWAERVGYDGFGVGERHNPAFLSSSPAVLLSHFAAHVALAVAAFEKFKRLSGRRREPLPLRRDRGLRRQRVGSRRQR
jgi:alkanesulfonate monooxygenase SsuD/methylene tetrahydromethanopterin reductase-like flavin-dependent oxidoreductase (luciferase family)